MNVQNFIDNIRSIINENDDIFIDNNLIVNILNDAVIDFCSNTNIYHGEKNLIYYGEPVNLPADLLRIIDVSLDDDIQLYPIDYSLIKTLQDDNPTQYYYILDYKLNLYPKSIEQHDITLRYVRIKETYMSFTDVITLNNQFVNVIKNYVIWKLKVKEENLETANYFKSEYYEQLKLVNMNFRNFNKSTTSKLKNTIIERTAVQT